MQLFGRSISLQAFGALAIGRYGLWWWMGVAAGTLISAVGCLGTVGPLTVAGAAVAAVAGEAAAGKLAYENQRRRAAVTRAWTRCLTLGLATGTGAIALLEGSGSPQLRIAAGIATAAVALRTVAAETYLANKAELTAAETSWEAAPLDDNRKRVSVDKYRTTILVHDGLVVARAVTGMLVVGAAVMLAASAAGPFWIIIGLLLVLVLGGLLIQDAEDEHAAPEPLRYPQGHANAGSVVSNP